MSFTLYDVVNLVVGALNCLLATGPYIVLYQPYVVFAPQNRAPSLNLSLISLNAVSFAITVREILEIEKALLTNIFFLATPHQGRNQGNYAFFSGYLRSVCLDVTDGMYL